jgi:HJR/Mrr/RecB family endonuclease
MYKVGIKEDVWVLVTDGNEIYCSTGDLRNYSHPPKLVTWPNTSQLGLAGNRISKLLMSPAELQRYCMINGISLKAILPISEACKNLYLPAFIGGGIGASVNGYFGASVGVGVCCLIAAVYCPVENAFSKIFLRAKQDYANWCAREREQAKLDEENLVRYKQIALDRWNRYHKLRNIAAVDTLSGVEFEVAIANLYERRGYQVTITKASGDFGVDVLATKDSESLAIQVKRYSSNVGVAAVQEVAAGSRYYKASVAVVITNSFFTEQAKVLAKTLRVRLIDKKGLAEMWDSAHTTTFPEFSMQRYDALKREIGIELYQLESASTGKPKKKFVARRKF